MAARDRTHGLSAIARTAHAGSAETSRRRGLAAMLVLGAATMVAAAGAGSAAAMSLVLATVCEPTTATLPVLADTWLDENSPLATKGTDSILSIEAGSFDIETAIASGRSRVLIRFGLPSSTPEGCVLESARLRVFSSEESVGTRVSAVRAASSWTESGASWINQPEGVGPAATMWSREGWMQWKVTAQVEAMLAGAPNHGFVMQDAAEGTEASGGGHGFYAREKGEFPAELVVQFAAPPTSEPPGPPPAPVEATVACGQVVTQSTLVANDLTECLGDGLVIGADRIIVDLGRHTIDGIGLGSGIANDGYTLVTVRNGTIQEFDHGVQLFPETTHNVISGITFLRNEVAAVELFDVTATEVSNNRLDQNGGGILLVSGTRDSVVVGNEITGNGGAGLLVRDSTGNHLASNSVGGGGDLGVGLERASDNTLLDNTVANNSDGGIELRFGSHRNHLEGNYISSSGDHGIMVSESDGNVLVSNATWFMSDSGITLDAANDGVARGNDVRFNTGGIQMDGASRNVVEGNDASHTSGIGIELGGGSYGNRLVGNTANKNGAQGIYVGDEAALEPGNLIEGNTANANLADGISVAKGGHTITSNVARDNIGWGINAGIPNVGGLGNIDGLGNIATGNHKPEQCVGVVCKAEWNPPETTIRSAPGPTRGSTATFAFDGTDDTTSAAALTFECSIDDGPFAACATPRTFAGLAHGPHAFAVRATDAADNTDPSPATHAWTIDVSPPETTIDEAPADPVASTSATFTFSSNEAGSTFACSLDGGTFVGCTSPATFVGLAQGGHAFEVRAIDAAGNVDASAAGHGWTVDTIPPDTTIDEGPADPTNATSAGLRFSSDEPASFECSLDGAAFDACTSPREYAALAEGSHSFTVRATDTAGNVDASAAVHGWAIDLTPPTTAIDASPTLLTNLTVASFAFSASEDATFACSLVGADVVACSSPRGYTDLADGGHTFSVRATDAAGNEGEPASLAWTVDTIPPATTIDAGPTALTNATAASLAFLASESGSTFACSLDGADFSGCTSPQAYTELSDGGHTFRVRATDPAGNEGATATHAWTVDTIPPATTIDGAPAFLTNATSASFAFSASEPGASFACSLDGAPFASCASHRQYAGLSDGDHTFRVRATDAAGNEGAPVLLAWTVDTIPPITTIESGPTALTNSSSATFVFSASEAATFACSLDGAAFDACPSPHGYTGLADGGHTFRVRATDSAGNEGAAATRGWTVDTIPPGTTIESGPASVTTTTSATISFASSEAADFACSLDNADFAACTSPREFQSLADGDHTFRVRATDAAGNEGAAATDAWTIDTIPPATTIDSGPASPTNLTAASFAFSASEAATFACSLDGASFTACASRRAEAGLADGGHTFRVQATDAAGNEGDPATHAWTVDATAPDTTIDTGPSGTTAATSATFTFSASEPESTFRCSLDSALLASCTSPAEYAGLAFGDHIFEVVAVDRAGNVDGSAALRRWTVAPEVDTTAPETTIDDGPSGATTSTTATFALSADEPGSTFECSLDAAPFGACSSPVEYRGLAIGGHTFAVRATDPAGNGDETPAGRAWTVELPTDMTPPDTTIDSGPSGTTTSPSATFAFSASESGSTFACSLDGAPSAPCSSTVTFTGLPDGNRSFEVTATDPAGNADPSPAVRGWTIDTTPPETRIDAGPSGPTNSTTATFEFSADGAATFACALDAGSFTACTSPWTYIGLAAGAHTFRVRATDGAGNVDQSPATRAWTVDTTSPQTTINTGPRGTVTSLTATFMFSASESGSTFQCQLDTAPFAACTSPTTYSGLIAGSHTFRVRATDPAGNTDASPATRTWTVQGDTTSPQTTINTGPSGTVTSPTATFTFSANESGSTFQCQLDTAAFAACTSPTTYSGLNLGSHTFRVRATDPAGNTDASPATRTWTVETDTGCATATLSANADAWLEQKSPASNKGTDSVLKVRTKIGDDNLRAIVNFALPAAPAGCVIDSATLRLYSDSAKDGRTLQAVRVTDTWTESAVTWGNQPATAGDAAATASGNGWRTWDVLVQVQEMATSGNYGFLIRDATENEDSEQSFHSREKGTDTPQLVITYRVAP